MIGKVQTIQRSYFEMENGHLLHNGDGLCFINAQGDLTGFRVNRVDIASNSFSQKGERKKKE